MSNRFHSPYQFLPVTGRLHGADPADDRAVPITDYAALASGDDLAIPARHDRWQAGCLSGRLICRLDTESPVIVGAEQTTGDASRFGHIKPYRLRGQVAIPASALRGLTASVAEAVSQSAMRVLADASYQVRLTLEQSLKAIGLLRRAEAGGWEVLPLAITMLELEHGRLASAASNKWTGVFDANCGLTDCLARYVGNYPNVPDASPNERPDQFDCFQEQHNRTFLYIPEDQPLAHTGLGSGFTVSDLGTVLKNRGRIAYRPVLSALPVDAPTPAANVRGVLYVLGHADYAPGQQQPRNAQQKLMPTKKHEWFVPWPASADHRRRLPVAPEVLAEFESLARKRRELDDDLPFMPKGYGRRGQQPMGEPGAFLRDGDLLYFDTDPEGQLVTRIAFSAIWRRNVPGTLYGAFRNAAVLAAGGGDDEGGNVLPWSPARDGLTPAECLFGVVEDMPKTRGAAPARDPARNLASRVRFSDAEPFTAPRLMDPVPLKAPASPKPPSPAMYFRQPGAHDGAVLKRDLSLDRHLPNGRKVYLHDPAGLAGHATWATARPPEELADYSKDGGRVGTPLAAGQSFWFHVDFDNLTQSELALLCTALMPAMNPLGLQPKERFLHKLGWGKPLGLGSSAVTIVGLYTHDRVARYTSADALEPEAPSLVCRYRVEEEDAAREAALCARFPRERPRVPTPALAIAPTDLPGALIDREALLALLAVGDPARVEYPVGYPYSTKAGQDIGNEQEGFKWFTGNTQAHKKQYQHLAPLPLDTTSNLTSLVAHHGELRLNLDAAHVVAGLAHAANFSEARQRIRDYFQAYGEIEVKGRDLTAGHGFATLLLKPEDAERLLAHHPNLVELARERGEH